MKPNSIESTSAGKPEASPVNGVIDPGRVRTALFMLSTTCVLLCVVMSILAIWDYVGNDNAFKMMASCGVIGAGAVLFEFLNRKFG